MDTDILFILALELCNLIYLMYTDYKYYRITYLVFFINAIMVAGLAEML